MHQEKHYISSKSETLPMFRNKFLDFFSRVHWIVPLIIYLPVIIGMIVISLMVYYVSLITVTALFAIGLFIWTLAEYGLHRFLFHYHAQSPMGKRLFWIMHGVHHDYPSDPLRLVMPPILSLPLACFFYLIFYFLLGDVNVLSFMSGFISGYLCYDMCHYAVHHFPAKGTLWNSLKTYHMRHHFSEPERGFGVTSSLWDNVFRTSFKKSKKLPAPQRRKNKSTHDRFTIEST